MNRLVLALAAVALAAASTFAQQGAEASKAIVKSYLDVQSHLAADKIEEAKTAARAIPAHAAPLGKAGEAIGKAAAALAAAPDNNGVREAFGPLSDAVIAHVQSDEGKAAAADLRLAYCPMVKKSWLQREGQIKNPYYGSSMLTCGELKPLKK
jgi:hypothetical protein